MEMKNNGTKIAVGNACENVWNVSIANAKGGDRFEIKTGAKGAQFIERVTGNGFTLTRWFKN